MHYGFVVGVFSLAEEEEQSGYVNALVEDATQAEVQFVIGAFHELETELIGEFFLELVFEL